MNYARLSLEELEELVQQQEQHLQELTEALIDKQRDAAWLAMPQRPGCVVFFTPSYPPSLYTTAEIAEREKAHQAKREMMALINRVGEKYELL